MISVDIRSNIRGVQEELKVFRQNIVDKATVASLNRAGTTMADQGAKEVQKTYTTLQIRKLKGYFRLERASRGRLNVKINPRGGRLPLTLFNTLEWRAKGGGVSVALGNQNVFIPHAFVRTRGARKAVYLRAQTFNGTLFDKASFRNRRVSSTGNDLPIAELFARSIPEVILRNGIDAMLVKIGEARFNEEFERQLKFYNTQLMANL